MLRNIDPDLIPRPADLLAFVALGVFIAAVCAVLAWIERGDMAALLTGAV